MASVSQIHAQHRSQYKMDENSMLAWWVRATAYAAFASLGGALGHLMRTFERSPFSWGRCTLESLAAGFVGLLMLLVCQAMELSEQWTGVIVGVSGWLGANATIRMLETIVRKRLGLDKDATHEELLRAQHDNSNRIP